MHSYCKKNTDIIVKQIALLNADSIVLLYFLRSDKLETKLVETRKKVKFASTFKRFICTSYCQKEYTHSAAAKVTPFPYRFRSNIPYNERK